MIFLSGAISRRVSQISFQIDSDEINQPIRSHSRANQNARTNQFENLPCHICAMIRSVQQLLKYLAQFSLKVFLKFLSIL